MEIKLTQKQKELIERLGVFYERSGMPPAQGRIQALLLVCDSAELSFDEIYMTLKISKSAASNAINSLLLTERLEYKTRPGDRRRYFSNRMGHMEGDFEKKMNHLLEINDLFKEILASRNKNTREFNSNLQKVTQFMDFLQKELPELYKKWRKNIK